MYQFNLLTVVDADMVRLHFNDTEITPSPVQSEHYIARYIVQKRQSFSRIHFVRSSAFASVLSDYNRLHATNTGTFASLEKAFYADALQDSEKVALFVESFRRKINWPLRTRLMLKLQEDFDFSSLDLSWNKPENRVDIEVHGGISEEALTFLQTDDRPLQCVKDALFAVYRYAGAFKFVEGIPF